MKIRSLLLGSVAAAGLATTGYAADLGVVTSLDVCDELGLSGLTISSDDNCLVVTGGVTFEYDVGDYQVGGDDVVYATYANNTGNNYSVADNDGSYDSNNGDVDAWLKFVATADSDFGPATATIKLISEDNTGTKDWTVGIDEAWVGIGDTTMLMAGYKSSIFNKGDDVPLSYLGLFNSDSVNYGVGFRGHDVEDLRDVTTPGVDEDGNPVMITGHDISFGWTSTDEVHTGGDVIQIVSNLGNGVQIGGGIEDLGRDESGTSLLTGVGVLQYAGDGVTAHLSGAVDTTGDWKTHAGFTGSWDPIKVVAAIANDSTGYYDALGSVAATFDMFTIAASGEAASDGYGVGGSISATVTDGVTLNLGGRYWKHTPAATWDVYQVEAGLSAAVTETLTLSAAVGATDRNGAGGQPFAFYGKAGLAWAPGGGFTAGSSITVTSIGGYKGVFTAAKTIQ